MTVQETRLKLAVRVTDRASRSDVPDSLDVRLATFRDAYTSLSALDAGTPGWTEDTLNAAWSLVEDAYPRGADPTVLLSALTKTFVTMSETTEALPPAQPRRPRRDA